MHGQHFNVEGGITHTGSSHFCSPYMPLKPLGIGQKEFEKKEFLYSNLLSDKTGVLTYFILPDFESIRV